MGRVILHHAALPHRGGAVRVARLLLEAQVLAGHDARLGFEVPENDPELLARPDQPQGPDSPIVGPVPTPPAHLGLVLGALPRDACLHLHTSTDWPALLSGLVGQGQGRRVLLTLHDAAPLTGGCAYPLDCPHFPVCADPCPRGFPRAQVRQAQVADLLRGLAPVLVSPSRWLAGLARQVLPGLAVQILPNGVPWPELSALPARARARAALGVPPGARVALFAAHGGPRAAYKSGPQWPEYWERLRAGFSAAWPDALPEALAFAVGGDAAASGAGLTIWPYVDRSRLALLMRAADLLLYPTLADNHPLVLLEAAALELPVASFAVGGVPEIVIANQTGILVDPAGGLEAFCRAAQPLLADPALSRGLGQAARAHGAKRFTVARMAADYARLMG